jgi:signal transduction histidine kinase
MIDVAPIRLLLVEDNPGDARLVREHLADIAGRPRFNLGDAPTLAQALEMARREAFDIVLLDLSLPDSAGLETLARWQAYAPELPVIVLTGLDDEAQAVAAVREGAQDYLVKGRIDGDVLSQAIRYAIERKRIQDALRHAKATLERRVEERTGELREINARLQSEIAERTLAQQQAAILLEREQEARLMVENVNRSKDEFLAVLSHELRTPLNAILGWSEILRSGESAPGEVREGIAIIERNARAQARLVEDVLEVSRIICGKVRLQLVMVDLPTALEAALVNARPAAAARGVALQFDREQAGKIPVWGDIDRLQQIVSNLLSNAIKFTPRGGLVTVTARLEGGRAEISVADTGIGIKADFLPLVFDRFRQSDASLTRNYGGLGLGLSITRHLVQMHSGTILAQSAGEDQGARFTVSLPLAPESSGLDGAGDDGPLPRAADARQAADVALLRGANVLVVDDEPDSRHIAVRLLKRAGGHVREAGSAAEAEGALREWDADVLISDIAMPGEDGYTFLRRLRRSGVGRLQTLPAVALTAFARPEDVKQALDAGFQVHLAKPIQPEALLGAVASLLRQEPAAAADAKE